MPISSGTNDFSFFHKKRVEGEILHSNPTFEIMPGKTIPTRCKFIAFPRAASSSEIRDALKDENLQKIICNIDSSPDVQNVSSSIVKLNCYLSKHVKQWRLKSVVT